MTKKKSLLNFKEICSTVNKSFRNVLPPAPSIAAYARHIERNACL